MGDSRVPRCRGRSQDAANATRFLAAKSRLRAVRDGMVAADAVAVEPVSTAKFPANREKNREFFNFGLARDSEVAIRPMIQLT